jgi:hypothetical protein
MHPVGHQGVDCQENLESVMSDMTVEEYCEKYGHTLVETNIVDQLKDIQFRLTRAELTVEREHQELLSLRKENKELKKAISNG